MVPFAGKRLASDLMNRDGELMNLRFPISNRSATGELEHLRTENAQLEQRLAEMERAIALHVAASRILWTYATDERRPGGA
jgi:hypothetical protein